MFYCIVFVWVSGEGKMLIPTFLILFHLTLFKHELSNLILKSNLPMLNYITQTSSLHLHSNFLILKWNHINQKRQWEICCYIISSLRFPEIAKFHIHQNTRILRQKGKSINFPFSYFTPRKKENKMKFAI